MAKSKAHETHAKIKMKDVEFIAGWAEQVASNLKFARPTEEPNEGNDGNPTYVIGGFQLALAQDDIDNIAFVLRFFAENREFPTQDNPNWPEERVKWGSSKNDNSTRYPTEDIPF